MTSTPASSLPEDQLLELLVQLQKTTPEQARAILNAQPAIGYALVPLMAKMGILNLEMLQKTLATYAGQTVPNTAAQVPTPVPPPVPTIPAHITQVPPYGHQPTPPPPSVPNAYSAPPNQPGTSAPGGYPGYPPSQAPQAQAQAQTQNGAAVAGSGGGAYPTQYGGQYQQQQQQYAGGVPGIGGQQQQQQQPQQAAPPSLGAFGNIPDDQREMIMRVIAMTPEQIRSLPPQERAITLQLRATLGLPAE
ncbi:hypothetical protein ACEPAF_4230 [Sanghuangporus sanghuang]